MEKFARFSFSSKKLSNSSKLKAGTKPSGATEIFSGIKKSMLEISFPEVKKNNFSAFIFILFIYF